jgi:hypothetical protein
VALDIGRDIGGTEKEPSSDPHRGEFAAPSDPEERRSGNATELSPRGLLGEQGGPHPNVPCRFVSVQHGASMRLPQSGIRKSDQDRQARRRAALATDHKILGGQCLGALERLFDYSLQLRENGRIEIEDLATAAEMVLSCVQRELLGRASPLEIEVAFELAYARAWAIHALVYVHGPRAAKEIELRLTDGAPLTICTGRTWQRYPYRERAAPFLGKVVSGRLADGREFRIPAYGCFAIFADTTQTTRWAWAHWCPDCKPNTGRRWPRARARAHKRALDEFFRVRQ